MAASDVRAARGESTTDGRWSRAELVARAVALQPLLREHAVGIDTQRRLPDEVATALADAGLFRLLTPQRLGGYETDLRTVVEVAETLGEADASAAWVVSLGNGGRFLIGLVSERAQDEVFGANPNARVAGGGDAAVGRQVEGGMRVSGRWAYASGSHHATWATLFAQLTNDAGEVADLVIGLVPASELTLEETWRTVGMRGTGSNTWVGEDIFVPDHLIISMSALAEEARLNPTGEAMYRVPFGPAATLVLMGPLLGVGRAALDLVISKAPGKGMHHTTFTSQTDSVGVQIQTAEAALKLKTARLHVYDAVDELDAAAAAGTQVSYNRRAEIRAQAGYAAQQVLDAINVLVNVHGAASFAESNRMQRYWRDANTAARHAGLNVMVGYEVYGKALLDVEERISAMV